MYEKYTTVAAILADPRNAFLHDDRHNHGNMIFTTDTIWLPGTAVTPQQETMWERVSNFMSGAWGQLEETVSGWWESEQTEEAVTESIPGAYSTHPDSLRRAQEDAILGILAGSMPVGTGDWRVVLGSGAHDRGSSDAFHAIDLNAGVGSADRDLPVFAVAGGRISKIDISYGMVVIDHPPSGEVPAWQSKYLHMPLYERQMNGRTEYVFLKSDGTEASMRIWKDMEVSARDPVGIVAGRGLKTEAPNGADEERRGISDLAFGAHLHFEAHLNGHSINMTQMVTEAWHMTVKADDGSEIEFGPLEWTTDVDLGGQGGMLYYRDQNLLFFRDPTVIDDTKTDYWVAWHPDIEQRKRVVWKAMQYVGESEAKARWVMFSDNSKEWNPTSRAFEGRILT